MFITEKVRIYTKKLEERFEVEQSNKQSVNDTATFGNSTLLYEQEAQCATEVFK